MAYINLDEAKAALEGLRYYSNNVIWHTENPPKKENYYLVTNEGGNLAICLWTDLFYGQKTGSWFWQAETYQKIVAWMPLPEPYTGGMEEGRK